MIDQEPAVALQTRTFQWSDSAGLHRLMHEVGDRSHRAEEHAIEEFDAELRAPRANPTRNVFIVERDGDVIGYSSAFPDLNIGRTVIRFGISPGHRRRGLGLALLTRAVERSRGIGARLAHVPAPAGDAASGALLQKAGFAPVRHFLRMVCARKPDDRPPARVGFDMREATSGDAGALSELQNAVFDGAWGYSPHTGDEIAALLGLPGRGPERVLLLCQRERLVAYAWTHLFQRAAGPAGIVTMTGVHPAFRRLGLGEAIAAAGVRSLFEAGAKSVELEVDSKNALAVGMYEHLGFVRRGGTFWYERRLK
jgi:mycothiol synthase